MERTSRLWASRLSAPREAHPWFGPASPPVATASGGPERRPLLERILARALWRSLAADGRQLAGGCPGLFVRHQLARAAHVLRGRDVQKVAYPGGVETGVLLHLRA